MIVVQRSRSLNLWPNPLFLVSTLNRDRGFYANNITHRRVIHGAQELYLWIALFPDPEVGFIQALKSHDLSVCFCPWDWYKAVTYNLHAVGKKSKGVPELKAKVLTGKLSVSTARKLVSVITKDNQKLWLDVAEKKSTRALEAGHHKAWHMMNPL